MTSESDIVLELRTMARLIETKKASITFNEQDAAHLRKAAGELEDMRATLDKGAKLALTAVHAERAAILAMIEAFADEQLVGRRAADYIAAAIRARGEQP
jgi:hypothetical protein